MKLNLIKYRKGIDVRNSRKMIKNSMKEKLLLTK